jgi:hypothetical protein
MKDKFYFTIKSRGYMYGHARGRNPRLFPGRIYKASSIKDILNTCIPENELEELSNVEYLIRVKGNKEKVYELL